MEKRTKGDWISAVLKDLEMLDINLEMEHIRMMEKKQLDQKRLKIWKKIKNSHTKVKNIEHRGMKIQKYLRTNSCKIRKEEAQLIFKLRCRTVRVKRNLKGMFDDMNCTACGLEEETQEHVLICSKLTNNKGDMNVKYEKLFNGTVSEKLMIAKMFKESYEVLENMKK